MASGNGKDGAKAGEFGNWSECFCVVNAIYLSESMSNKSCFVLGNATIGVLLDVEDPFRSNDVLLDGCLTMFQVSALQRDSSSLCMASFHIGQSDLPFASASDPGSIPSASKAAAPIANSTPPISKSCQYSPKAPTSLLV